VNTALAIAGTVAGLALIVFISVRIMAVVFKRSSGYLTLVDSFPCHERPDAGLTPRQTVVFGAVRYGRAVEAGILDDGLFLQVRSWILGRHRPVLIPWAEISACFAARIRTLEAVRLEIGRPSFAQVTVPARMYADLRTRLTAASPVV
jgi:hypothetical protein